MKVRELMKRKPYTKVITAGMGESLSDAVAKMAVWHIGALIITEDECPVGIVTERDVVRCLANGGCSMEVKVEEAMTKGLRVVEPDDSVLYATQIMHQKGIRHLPVVENGRLEGVLSLRDILFAGLEELESEVKDLKDYITC
jgi:CBS domain-containing protein